MTGFIAAILLIVFGVVKFDFKDIWKTYLCIAVMFGWGALLDFVIFPGRDYMYLRNDPLSLDLSFPYHILYGIIISVYVLMYYLVPFVYRKIKAKIKSKKEKSNA